MTSQIVLGHTTCIPMYSGARGFSSNCTLHSHDFSIGMEESCVSSGVTLHTERDSAI